MKEYLAFFNCVIPSSNCIYLSVPITTGKNFINWYKTKGSFLSKENYKRAHYNEVILLNIQKVKPIISKIRLDNKNQIVIEPTSLEMPNWSQLDYHQFWVEVINKFVGKAIFTPGWEYSKGCSLEFLTAIRKGVEIVDISNRTIFPSEGLKQIKKAIKEYKSANLNTEFLDNIVEELTITVN